MCWCAVKKLLGIWRDSLHVTCGLTACTPGSAPGPTLGNEYGKTLPLPFYVFISKCKNVTFYVFELLHTFYWTLMVSVRRYDHYRGRFKRPDELVLFARPWAPAIRRCWAVKKKRKPSCILRDRYWHHYYIGRVAMQSIWLRCDL